MSDDIPPLIPETPPPMTKLDWEDDEDFMDYPHLALELPSESSLSPDGGWNPIDELSLPYDGDVIREPAACIESNSNDTLSKLPSNISMNDPSVESSLSEQQPSLHQNNLSIWKDKKDISWENINKLTNDSCDNVNEIDCNTEIKHNESSENIIDNNRKIVDDDLSVTSDQYICDLENVKNNTIPPNLPNLVLQLNNSEVYENNETFQPVTNVNFEKSTDQKTLVNGYLECVNVKESSNQTNCVQNVLLENLKNDVSDTGTPNDTYVISVDDLSVNNNNNNNIIIKNDQEEYSDFCDFETNLPDSLNVPLPNRTSQENHEITEDYHTVDQHNIDKIPLTQLNDEHCTILKNIEKLIENKIEQNVESISPDCSTFQNNEINVEHNSGSEFDEFSDFHVFSNSTIENKLICDKNDDDDDFCNYETSIPNFNDSVKFKHSNVEEVQCSTSNINDLVLKPDNQNSVINNDDDDDNFCDFESGYTTSGYHTIDQVKDSKQNCANLDSESHVPLDYKQFCKDAFQGDYELCEETDLQNLDNELNESQVWQGLKDVDSSPALNYNWTKSESNNVFLASLSIDSRNILYGASWNPKVPRFAANMSNNPLEPLKASNNDTTDTKISQSFSNGPMQDTVPDPEFDWKSSGLINPLDFQPQTWKTSEVVKEEEIHIQSSPESTDVFDEFFSASLPSSSDNQSIDTIDSPSSLIATVSHEAQRILDNLPDFEFVITFSVATIQPHSVLQNYKYYQKNVLSVFMDL
ncbi:aftiphilin isoform X3 [Rhopalosiphum padi]|uniref:aftiphilin isoform X3 n=1 Tax=Rhopalosiphum padi TaxID=40932 RepID=UPI00298E087D|nr:aftiphilin isoform X3 [Rhopalosiphum padi]